MELEEVYRRDLNLLIALKVLLEENSVSQAAVRLNLSQSAMSRVLGRLRDLLGDPLFTRQGQHLVPTQKALEINEQINLPLESLRQLLTPSDFTPMHCDQHFLIATTDYAMQTILPYALPKIYEQAPNISLEFAPLNHENLFKQLSTEKVDMAICRPIGSVLPLKQEVLGQVGVLCLLSKNHPLSGSILTLDDYLSLPHAMIAISDGVKALIDAALSGQRERRQVLRAYHLEAALAIVDKMPLVITVPADLAYLVAERYDLVIKPLPFEFTPFDYSLIWHSRCDTSPAQTWLRRVVKEECGKLIEKRIEDIGFA
ncbi:LysR family transcriptional regulator [Aliivibrio fischeri]|uniref:Transcriptional regulator, LysR family n=2 Tax=Aliivibrio fischeri TaxID=668 RepID=Q5E8Y0_ALIF1|nr:MULTISPECIES: LysR family transcriptional regulator [Aliivibrio]AAW84516.1 transcriptional regulator, LysR family [Aliivibrio fischeri ES114]KLU79025.1 LysR family transcriptional regulator [Aliivibrio fischeri]MBD1570890.1 LysR family transcriptional regulator [Aliivibrio sp. S10_S31]MBP3140519.1 LysR family transcriptional regulator [Aliivibrio fischeri]MBP3156163.1 LysR family transcriptional regulator [Aliivibrio fischeri]